jgi:hypothetical protein
MEQLNREDTIKLLNGFFDEREELKSLRAHFNALPILINAIKSSKDPDTRKAIEQWDEARTKLDVFKYNGD